MFFFSQLEKFSGGVEDLEVKFCSDCWALGAAEAHHQDKVTFGGKAQSHPNQGLLSPAVLAYCVVSSNHTVQEAALTSSMDQEIPQEASRRPAGVRNSPCPKRS